MFQTVRGGNGECARELRKIEIGRGKTDFFGSSCVEVQILRSVAQRSPVQSLRM
jgi:hypothetical protein